MAGGEDRQAHVAERVPLRLRTGDLPKRIGSAIVMLAVSGTALWLGGIFWTVFVLAVAFGVWFEWTTLVLLFKQPGAGRSVWRIAGIVYCGVGAAVLIVLRDGTPGLALVLMLVGAVIGTDVGAYFAGRTFGGPKIAPRISPSKTWSGLAGGVVGASLVIMGVMSLFSRGLLVPEGEAHSGTVFMVLQAFGGMGTALGCGLVVAVTAQAGDFFESWMKRRAGVKDSSKLLPGHGGLFDRVDGLLAVCFVLGLALAVPTISVLLAGEPAIPSQS